MLVQIFSRYEKKKLEVESLDVCTRDEKQSSISTEVDLKSIQNVLNCC